MMMLTKNGTRHPQLRNWSPEIALTRQHRQSRQEKPGWRAELWPGRDKSAVSVRARPLHRKQHRAAPFAAEPETLDEANDGQNDSAPNADLLVGRNKAHGKDRKAGQQQSRDQRRLAAYPIPIMAEDHRPDGAGHKTDGVDGERLQHADERIGPGKEELAEDQSGHL